MCRAMEPGARIPPAPGSATQRGALEPSPSTPWSLSVSLAIQWGAVCLPGKGVVKIRGGGTRRGVPAGSRQSGRSVSPSPFCMLGAAGVKNSDLQEIHPHLLRAF